VTNVYFSAGSIEDEKHWLISVLPNLKYLSFNNVRLSSSNSELSERIQKLVFSEYTNSATIDQFNFGLFYIK
jgi:hypothetical protein